MGAPHRWRLGPHRPYGGHLPPLCLSFLTGQWGYCEGQVKATWSENAIAVLGSHGVFLQAVSGRPSIPREQSPQWTLSYRHVTFGPQTKDRGCGDGKVSEQGMSSCPKGQTKGLRGGERQPQAPCEQGLARVAQNLKLSPRLAQASGKEPNLQLISQDLLINHHGPLLSAWALSGRSNIGRTFIYSPTSHSGTDT